MYTKSFLQKHKCFPSDLKRFIPRTCSVTTQHRENKTKQERGFKLISFCVKSVSFRSFSGANARKKGPQKLRIWKTFYAVIRKLNLRSISPTHGKKNITCLLGFSSSISKHFWKRKLSKLNSWIMHTELYIAMYLIATD